MSMNDVDHHHVHEHLHQPRKEVLWPHSLPAPLHTHMTHAHVNDKDISRQLVVGGRWQKPPSSEHLVVGGWFTGSWWLVAGSWWLVAETP